MAKKQPPENPIPTPIAQAVNEAPSDTDHTIWQMADESGNVTFEIEETDDMPRMCRVSVSSKYDMIFSRLKLGGSGLKVKGVNDAKRVGQALKAWIRRGQRLGAARIQAWPDGTHRVFWVEKKSDR